MASYKPLRGTATVAGATIYTCPPNTLAAITESLIANSSTEEEFFTLEIIPSGGGADPLSAYDMPISVSGAYDQIGEGHILEAGDSLRFSASSESVIKIRGALQERTVA